MTKHDISISQVTGPVSIHSAHAGRLAQAIVVLLLCAALSFQEACSSGDAGGAAGAAGTSTGGAAGVGGNGGAGGTDFACVGSQGNVPDAGIEICHAGQTYCHVQNIGGAPGTDTLPGHCVPLFTTPACPTVENLCACTVAYFTATCSCTGSSSSGLFVTCYSI